MTALPTVLPAHGVGSRQDLPLPFDLLLIGAGLALAISFVALGVLWKQPRLHRTDGRLLPPALALALDSPFVRGVFAALSLALTAWTLLALFFGKDDANNPVPYVVYVYLWVGLGLLSLVFGPIWRVLNPVRQLHRGVLALARVPPDFSLAPYRLGWWPAALGLFAFTWLELIAPDNTTLPVLRVAIVGFLLVSLLLALVFGRDYFATGDPFEAWSGLYGSLSPLGRRADGRWVLRTPLHGPNEIAARPGLVATTSVMLGGTAYDGFSSETWWYTFVQSSDLPGRLWQTLALVVLCLLVAGMLWAAAAFSALLAKMPARGLATAFAPSLVPIAAGYLVAHYWSLFVYEGVNGLAKLSDPLGSGANWLGTAGLEPSLALIEPTLVATIQVVGIITGHLLGVVVAHERAVALFPRRVAVTGQVPLLVLMVLYTVGGLTLLFSA
ncbi:hypothetical protein [Knoellia sp. p5-6-4]|uniref:hypothetical protein n=1 Tax=unclassified Knoellia TaxID=2618719 RepID=UPI0023DBAA21|nr:hypothetical protein [Knoellia sp. p5-6-4]MDF2146391.1 hypothetical protein [Knoellia sp. p5-6-4]